MVNFLRTFFPMKISRPNDDTLSASSFVSLPIVIAPFITNNDYVLEPR